MIQPSLWRTLNEIHPVSRETFDRLSILAERLRQWQTKTNLVAPSTLDSIWQRHIADSLQCISIMPAATKWLDLGSGGGFPGLVIAACMAEIPNAQVTLVESNRKKAAFLRQVNRQMESNAWIIAERIEDLEFNVSAPQIVTARALAPLADLLTLASPWLFAGATALLHKGREYREELEQCHDKWGFDLLIHPSKVDEQSVLLEISNLSRKDDW